MSETKLEYLFNVVTWT